jgi:thiol-disulfide isomerase/thioredoxin
MIAAMVPQRRCHARLVLLALLVASPVLVHGACATNPVAPVPVPESEPASTRASVIAGRVLSDGVPVAGISVRLGSVVSSTQTSETGVFELSVPESHARAHAVYVIAERQSGERMHVVLPLGLGPLSPDLDLAVGSVSLRDASPAQQAWLDAQMWVRAAADQWWAIASDDHDSQRALWQRLQTDIDAEPDPDRRGLMLVGQFGIGRGDPAAGLSRAQTAEHALAELAIDDPRWMLDPRSLMTAMFETGRLDEFWPTLESLIATHPQPEFAAYVALERYMSSSAAQQWDVADAIWARVEARPELLSGINGEMLRSQGPTRPLAPGRALDDFCVQETFASAELCTESLRGRIIVLEFWSTWCEGCRESAAVLAGVHAEISDGEASPVFLSVDVYDDPERVVAFVREQPMPWQHGWLPEAEREAFRDRFSILSIPTLVIVDRDGRIVASSPGLRPEGVREMVERVHAAASTR